MRVGYREVDDLDDVVTWLSELGARTVIFDVEPLVAAWNTGPDLLRHGVRTTITRVLAVRGIDVVGFATNSGRHLAVDPDRDGVRLFYLSRAAKPLRTRRLRELPHPAVLVGDQVATDGLLAWRLGVNFAHVRHTGGPRPWRPRLMSQLGRPLAPRLFDRHPDQRP